MQFNGESSVVSGSDLNKINIIVNFRFFEAYA